MEAGEPASKGATRAKRCPDEDSPGIARLTLSTGGRQWRVVRHQGVMVPLTLLPPKAALGSVPLVYIPAKASAPL